MFLKIIVFIFKGKHWTRREGNISKGHPRGDAEGDVKSKEKRRH
jgi:hypothetical protein